MSLDIRIPIGLLFCIIGAILMVYGVGTWGKGMYALSLGYNINLSWGGVLGLFGVAMLWLARRAAAGRIAGTGRRRAGESARRAFAPLSLGGTGYASARLGKWLAKGTSHWQSQCHATSPCPIRMAPAYPQYYRRTPARCQCHANANSYPAETPSYFPAAIFRATKYGTGSLPRALSTVPPAVKT